MGIEDNHHQIKAIVANSSLTIKTKNLNTQVQDILLVAQVAIRQTKQGTGLNQHQ